MAQNFLPCDREQELLLPPSPREWLPPDHFAWFVLDVVEELDLAAFLVEYRQDGWGRAAFDPAMMVALLLDADADGERSSRAIERHCREDVASASSPPTRRRITRRSRASACATRRRSARCSRRCSGSAPGRGWCVSG